MTSRDHAIAPYTAAGGTWPQWTRIWSYSGHKTYDPEFQAQVCTLLQMAERAETGPWPLRLCWRALYWAITELPAHLEALLPWPPVVPYAVHEPMPAQPDSSIQCEWAPSVPANGSARAVNT